MSTYHLTNLIQTAATKMGTLACYKPSPVLTSATTLILTDSTLTLTADELIRGTAIITHDAGGLGAAPEGEMQAISDNSTSTITVGTAFTGTPAAGDEVMILRPKYPLVEWRRAANVVLKSFGPIPLFDTSITMSALTEYTLPAAVLAPIKVFRQSETVTDDYQWKEIPAAMWRVEDAAPGTQRTLIIDENWIDEDKLLGITYESDHPDVYDYDDHIDVPIELAASKLAWYMINRGGITDKNRSQAEKVLAELNDAEKMFKIPNKQVRKDKLLVWK